MNNLEKMKIFYEDVYEASCFWKDECKKNYLTIFIENIIEYNHVFLITEALKRPLKTIAEEDKFCTSDDFGPIVVSETLIEDKIKYTYSVHEFIPSEYEPYLLYFLEDDISHYPNGNKIKQIMDNYFKTRNII